MTLPDSTYKLEGISPRAFQHPADRAATAALKQVPYLDAVVRRLIELGYERALRQAMLGSAVRLGQEQLPRIWVLEREVFHVLDLEDVPDLYLTQFPDANALTFGSGRPVIVLNSELVRLLDAEGLRVVIAHEAAHVLSDHVLYQTALTILLQLGASIRLPIFAGLPLLAIRTALLEWSRAAELSCDRAAALVTRDPMAVCRVLMTISGGEAVDELNLDAFMKQGLDYDEKGSGLERLTRLLMHLNITHPMPVRRTHELLELGPQRRLRPHQGRLLRPRAARSRRCRDEAGAAQEHLRRAGARRVQGRGRLDQRRRRAARRTGWRSSRRGRGAAACRAGGVRRGRGRAAWCARTARRGKAPRASWSSGGTSASDATTCADRSRRLHPMRWQRSSA